MNIWMGFSDDCLLRILIHVSMIAVRVIDKRQLRRLGQIAVVQAVHLGQIARWPILERVEQLSAPRVRRVLVAAVVIGRESANGGLELTSTTEPVGMIWIIIRRLIVGVQLVGKPIQLHEALGTMLIDGVRMASIQTPLLSLMLQSWCEFELCRWRLGKFGQRNVLWLRRLLLKVQRLLAVLVRIVVAIGGRDGLPVRVVIRRALAVFNSGRRLIRRHCILLKHLQVLIRSRPVIHWSGYPVRLGLTIFSKSN